MASEASRETNAREESSRLPQMEGMLAGYSQNKLTLFLLKDTNGHTF